MWPIIQQSSTSAVTLRIFIGGREESGAGRYSLGNVRGRLFGGIFEVEFFMGSYRYLGMPGGNCHGWVFGPPCRITGLCDAIMIFTTLVNTHTHTHTHT